MSHRVLGSRMPPVEDKLARWKKLHDQVGEAQARLNVALQRNAPEADLHPLRLAVTELQRASDVALEEVQAQLAAMKSSPSGFTPL